MFYKLIRRFFARYSIRQKIVIGFGSVILLNLIIGALGAGALYYIDEDIHWVIDEIRPAREKSYEMQHSVLLAKQGLGFYLLNPLEEYRDQIEVSMDKAFSELKELEQMPFTLGSVEKQEILKLMQLDLQHLYDAKEVVYSYEDNAYENMPGLKYAKEKILPIYNKVFNLLHYSDQLETMTDEDKETVTQLANLWNKIELHLKDYLLHRDAAIIDSIQSKLNASQTLLDRYDTNQRSLFESIIKHQAAYQESLQSLVEIHSGENWRKDRAYLKSHIAPIIASIKKNYNEFNKLQKSKLVETVSTLHDLFHKTYYMLSFVMLGSLVIGVILSLLLIRDVSNKMRRIVDAMEEISEKGNLNQKLDEEGEDEMAKLADSFNRFVTKIKGVVDLVSMSSSNLAIEAAAMSEKSDNARDGVMQQQTDIVQTAHAINQMSDTMNDISSSANMAADAAIETSQNAAHGQGVVSDSIQSINTLANEVDSTREIIQKLGIDIEDIGSVLIVIKGITEQTNLLALNAAIEAARAGESGRGFAVVADEVRTLSQRIQHETQGIQEKIERLQSEARVAIAAIEKGKQMTEDNVSLAASAGEALNAIADSVVTITDMNQKIASSVEQQSHQSLSINENMNSIRQIADETAGVVINASKSNHELSLMAGQLRGMVQQFLFNESCSKAGQEDEMFHVDSGSDSEKNNAGDVNDDVDDVLF